MHIQFLTRKPQIRRSHALVQAAIKSGHRVELLDVGKFMLSTSNQQVLYEKQIWKKADVVYPFWSQYDSFMPLLLDMMKQHGQCIYKPIHRHMPNKISAAMLLCKAGIPSPKTYIISSEQALFSVLKENTFPLILKLSYSSQGRGVFLHKTAQSIHAQVEQLCSKGVDFVIQECIYPLGVDVRAFVINGKVCAAMERTAVGGEFRANIALGASSKETSLSPQESEIVCKATALFGLETSGVDFIRTLSGPVVLEVNREPGYTGIMECTKQDIAGMVIQDMERLYLSEQ